MRVLVTGSRGYVGVVLAPMLQGAGFEVTGLDSDLYRGCDYGAAPTGPRTIEKDIRHVTPHDLAGFDAVVHLAGLSNDPLGDIDPALTDEINNRATVRLAQMAREAGVSRFVFSSSCSNYGVSDGGWLTEDSAVNPITPYAVSKVQAEAGLAALADARFSPVYLRSGTAFGYSPRLRFDLVVNNLTAWAMATGQVRLKSDGSAWRPLVHVTDMARAFETVLRADRDQVHDRAFNVGSRENCMQVRDIARLVEEEVSGARVSFAPGAEADQRTYRVDCARLEALGFRARVSVREGVRELRDAFARFGVSVADFEGSRYQRVRHIVHQMETGALGGDLVRLPERAA